MWNHLGEIAAIRQLLKLLGTQDMENGLEILIESLLKPIRVMSSRHSAFYTPLLLAVELGSTDQSFLKSVSEDFECSYALQKIMKMFMKKF